MRHCLALDKMYVGRRELWARCQHQYGHEGPHHDPKFKGHYWEETFRAFEFETGRKTKAGAIPTAKKVRLCKKCSKQIRTDGASYACVCKETGANKRQAIMFADERELLARQKTMDEMQSDIDSLMAQWKRMEEDNGYHAEF